MTVARRLESGQRDRMPADPSLFFINQHYWPDVAATGQHLTDLAEYLAGDGFDVRVLTGRADYRGGELEVPERETRRGVRIRRVDVPGFGRGKDGQAGRITDYVAFHLRAVVAALRDLAPPNLVISLTTPSMLPATVRSVCALRGVPYGVWAMDLHPDVEDRLGLLPGGRLVAPPLYAAGRWGYRGADFVVALGPAMQERLRAKGVPGDRLYAIPAWSRADEVRPVPREANPLRGELGLGDAFVVMYAGNAGLAHRFDELIEAMDALRDEPDLAFVFVGDGPRREEIERAVRARSIPNFRYLDYFPREELDCSLSLADVHLLTLREDMAGLTAPSKLQGILAAGRPVLMVGPGGSDPGVVVRSEGVGEVIEPDSNAREGGRRLAGAIIGLKADEDRRRRLGRRARKVFEERFTRDVCCARWSELLRDRIAERGGEGPR